MKKYTLSISMLVIALIAGVFLHIDITQAQEEETHIIGSVPQDFETSADLEWTGGTLYQLKARLQTLGCQADQIMIYNEEQDKWFLYSQYSWPLSFNQEFRDNYPEDYIPPSTIHIPNCYDMCEFEYTQEVIDGIEDPHDLDNIEYWRRCNSPEDGVYHLPIFDGIECNQGWDPRTIERVFPIMPVMQDLCIFRTNTGSGIQGQYDIFATRRGEYTPMNFYFPYNNIWFPLYRPWVSIYDSQNEESFFTELHEICHSQQDWYVSQFMSPYELYTESRTGLWSNTSAGQWLIDRAQLEVTLDENIEYWRSPNKKLPEWTITPDSLYRGIYPSIDYPHEIGAQLCAISLYLKITGEESVGYYGGNYSLETIEDATDWLEDYIFVLEE